MAKKMLLISPWIAISVDLETDKFFGVFTILLIHSSRVCLLDGSSQLLDLEIFFKKLYIL